MNGFRPPRIIETDALTLRPFVAADAGTLFSTMLGDAALTTWLSVRRHRSMLDSLRYIHDKEAAWLAGTEYSWAVVERASGVLVAAIDLRASPPRAEIGVIVSARATPRQRRAGLAALLRLIRWLLAQPSLYRIEAHCAPQSAAASTMQKLGFTLDARLTNWLSLPNTVRQVGDALLFSICRPVGQDGQPATLPAEAVAASQAAHRILAARVERLTR